MVTFYDVTPTAAESFKNTLSTIVSNQNVYQSIQVNNQNLIWTAPSVQEPVIEAQVATTQLTTVSTAFTGATAIGIIKTLRNADVDEVDKYDPIDLATLNGKLSFLGAANVLGVRGSGQGRNSLLRRFNSGRGGSRFGFGKRK